MRCTLFFSVLCVAFVLFSHLTFAQRQAESRYGFKENKGQWHEAYKYRYNQGGFYVFLVPNGWFYYLTPSPPTDHFHGGEIAHGYNDRSVLREEKQVVHGISLSFTQSKSPVLLANRPHKAYHNYFLGNDRSRWASGVQSFRSVWYCDLYDYIDAEVEVRPWGMKYNFRVYPGGDPNEISMNIEGASGIYVLKNRLYIETAYGNMVEQIPLAYQVAGDRKIVLGCSYYLKDDKTVGFRVEDYNPALTLVIDPELIGASISGSTQDNRGFSACYDSEGNIYVSGAITGPSFGDLQPAPGVIQVDFFYLTDICVAKFNPDLSELLFFTYLGGENREIPVSTLVDEQRGFFYLYGASNSASFPITDPPFQDKLNGIDYVANPYDDDDAEDVPHDIVMVKTSLDGRELLASTYVGGSGYDGGEITNGVDRVSGTSQFSEVVDIATVRSVSGEIALDVDGGPVVVSYTSSPNFPNISGTKVNTSSGSSLDWDAILFKMDSKLSAVVWAEYLGGDETDIGTSLVLTEDFIYVAGHTRSTNFLPITAYPILDNKSNNPRGTHDAFVVRMSLAALNAGDANKNTIIRFLGSEKHDRAYFLDLGTEGDLYVAGSTHGPYPVENVDGRGAHQSAAGHFIHKLSPDLSTTDWAITFGSLTHQPQMSMVAFQVDNCDRIYLTGWGGGNNYAGLLRVASGYCVPEGTNPCGLAGTDVGKYNYWEINLKGLPVTVDALRSETPDGNDFYSVVFSKGAKEVLYGSYYGGEYLQDHTDGGTSRYDKDGVVYQAMCACFGLSTPRDDFPATENAFQQYADADLQGCNMAGLKLDLGITGVPTFSTNSPEGTLPGVSEGCVPTTIRFTAQREGQGEDRWEIEKKGAGLVYAALGSKFLDYTFDEEGEYEVRFVVTDHICGIKRKYSRDITIRPGKAYRVSDDLELCGEYAATLFAEPVEPAEGVKYSWTPETHILDSSVGGQIETTRLPFGKTTFDVLIEDGTCINRESVVVDVRLEPTALIAASTEGLTACKNGGEVIFTGSVTNAESFYWDMGDGTPITQYRGLNVVSHKFLVPGTHTVTLVGASGPNCRAQDTVEVVSTGDQFPNILTPNSDGMNDYFVLPSILSGDGSYTLRVYDRLGALVHASDDYKNEWNADGLPADVYFYALTINRSDEVCKGWLHVLR